MVSTCMTSDATCVSYLQRRALVTRPPEQVEEWRGVQTVKEAHLPAAQDHPSDLARASRLSMDFGGHLTFDHGMDDEYDETGLFADAADHDFSLPPTYTTVHPPSTQQAGQHTGPQADTTNPSGFSKGAVRHRELTSRPDAAGTSQRRVTSPLNRRSVGSGVSKSRPTAPTATVPTSGSLRRSLQETLHRASSIQMLASQMAALHARSEMGPLPSGRR